MKWCVHIIRAYSGCSIVSELRMAFEIIFIRMGLLKKERRLKSFWGNRYKFVIIWAEHIHVNIIIPRNKSFMTYCA